VEVGLTTSAEVVAPVLQEYVTPPDAVSVALLPAQMVVEPETVATGRAFTVTVTESVSEHKLLTATSE
jgi:hypothetical protein